MRAGSPPRHTAATAGRAVGLAAGSVVVGGLVLRLAPAVTALRGIRMAFAPGLAGVGQPGHVALTFDDGPDPASTPRFARVLARHGVRATFFVLGAELLRAPEVGAGLAAAGHELAVHGWTHRHLALCQASTVDIEVARTRDLIEAVSGRVPRFYRPPYGILTTAAVRAARRADLAPVLWTAWGRDWRAHSTSDSVRRAVARGLRPGGTILLHDSDRTSAPGAWRASLAALPRLLDDLARRGLRVGPLREHHLVP